MIVSRDLKADRRLRTPFNCQECCLRNSFQIQDKLAFSYRCKICSTIFALSCKIQNLNKLLPLVLLFWRGPGSGAIGNETEIINIELFCYPNKNVHPTGIFQYNHSCSRAHPSQGKLLTCSRCSTFFTGLFGDNLNTLGG